jgi:hypothetical protein
MTRSAKGFRVAARDRAGLWGEVIMAGELEEPGVEADVIADALEDDALQVVVEQRARRSLERGEGLDVAAQETLQRLIEGKARVAGARPGEHEHETGQDARGGADADLTEVAPIDLALFAGSVSRRR